MCTYLKNMEGYKHKDFKGKSFDVIKKMFDKAYKRVNTFVAMDSEIKRSDGSSKVYKVLYAMLNDFDRQDLIDLYKLVKKRFKTTQPEGYDILLWGDLLTIFEPSEQDELWRNQQHYLLISWELFDSCRGHSLLMDTVSIHMLVERIYPLIQLTLERMLNTRLQVDHECEIAYELIRFIKSQYKK
ncbi:hypothetical protein Tco_0454933 [Tanacetum coccineum]